MIEVSAKAPQLSTPSFGRQDLLKIGAKTIESIRQRVSQGNGVNDQRMKRLSPEYARHKGKRLRTLSATGSMLGAITVIKSSDKSLTIGFNRRSELIKAAANQRRDRWFGISPRNEEAIVTFTRRIFTGRS